MPGPQQLAEVARTAFFPQFQALVGEICHVGGHRLVVQDADGGREIRTIK